MRGRTLKIVLQYWMKHKMQQRPNKNVSNKIGENSKLVVNGDPSQIDLINKSQSGLLKSKNIKNI